MKIKTYDFGDEFKARAVLTDRGLAVPKLSDDGESIAHLDMLEANVSTRHMHTSESGVLKTYGHLHAANLTLSTEEESYLSEIKVLESDLKLFALSMTCREVSKMMVEHLEKGNDPVGLKITENVSASDHVAVTVPMLARDSYSKLFPDGQAEMRPLDLKNEKDLKEVTDNIEGRPVMWFFNNLQEKPLTASVY